ncbi:MAG: uroporphyrinogen decarboxylase [Deltaproteobacteria bacterium]|nr:MAG: uroporphyrinogen decarboxylase [Deltaproteobacteria bacterium]
MNPKERFLNACRQKPVDRPPVWMMRQAGRYLPEYRAIRKNHPTLEMMKNPDIACEITLQPVDLVKVDAAILYSDILIVPEAMGLKLDFVKDHGPVFDQAVRSTEALFRLNRRDVPERCPFVFETIKKIKQKLPQDFPLLGFAGAPFTVGAYMVGGDGSYEGNEIKKLAFQNRHLFRQLMEKLTHATIDYLKAQVSAGVDAVQLFDTWAGTLNAQDYEELALPYTREILKAINETGTPTILYIKGGSHLFSKMLQSQAQVISIDWRLSLSEAKQMAQGSVAIQGNFDPAHLYLPIPKIEEAVRKMFEDWGTGPGYIINLGHGITPDVSVENAKAFIDYAKQHGATTLS